MRLLHQKPASEAIDLAWTLRTAPARSGALLVLCGSMLVSLAGAKPKRAETPRAIAHRAAPRKAAGDFLVSASAVPPAATSAMRVAIELGGRRKEMAVYGERVWRTGPRGLEPSAPEPFAAMPLTWERTFGGAGDHRNPVGLGFAPAEPGNKLANIEYADRRVSQPGGRPPPAGFGPVDPQWQPRLGMLGTFDDAWLAANWPLMPDDFDPLYWNEAPPDQQFPGHFRGDEHLAFEGMHAKSPRLEWRLPGLRARVFGQLANGRQGELRAVLDTIDVDLHAGQAELVWRAAMPVRSPRCKEVAFLFTLCEPLDAPIDEAGWKARFEATRRARYPTAEEREVDAAPAAAARAAETEARKARTDAIRAQAMQAAAAAEARAAAIERPPQPPPDPAAQRAAIAAAFAQARAQDPNKGAALGDTEARVLAAHAKMEQRQRRWTRERVVAAYQAGEDLKDADLSGLDLSKLDLTGARMAGAEFTGTQLGGSVLQGADLAGCDFSEAAAAGADFSSARLADARFRGADLAGAVFQDATADKADFGTARAAGAVFDGMNGAQAQFDAAELEAARFRGAKLPGASFAKARIAGACFDAAQLAKANFADATGADTSFDQADIDNLRAPRAQLPGARFTGATGPRSAWRMTDLAGADFSRAQLTRANFAEAMLNDAVFDRAILADASFDDATMQRAVLTHADLLRASCVRADLADADLRGANLFRAGLFGARASRARLDGSFLAGTLLAG